MLTWPDLALHPQVAEPRRVAEGVLDEARQLAHEQDARQRPVRCGAGRTSAGAASAARASGRPSAPGTGREELLERAATPARPLDGSRPRGLALRSLSAGQTRVWYSPVRVSTRMTSPSSTNRGTWTTSPVSRVAGLRAPVACRRRSRAPSPPPAGPPRWAARRRWSRPGSWCGRAACRPRGSPRRRRAAPRSARTARRSRSP